MAGLELNNGAGGCECLGDSLLNSPLDKLTQSPTLEGRFA